MKIQYIAVIFVIIIIPISIVMSQYIQTQIDTITLQTAHTKNLDDATHDAIKAFQINSINNKYSSVSDSKIRDIEASINTFYNSLGTSMEMYVSSKEQLSGFIPAILFTLYDGYYIHSLYNNVYSTQDTDDDGVQDTVAITEGEYQDGLRPYIYYSAKYQLGTDVIVVNYTLDNEITVYGKLKDFNESGIIEKKYLTKSGYLINPENVTSYNLDEKKIVYDGIEIGPETLIEHLITFEEDSNGNINNVPIERDYKYIIFNNQKVYQDVDENGNIIYTSIQVPKYDASGKFEKYETIENVPKLFWYDEYKKKDLQGEAAKVYQEYFGGNTDNRDETIGKMEKFESNSAFEYYYQAYIFSDWVVNTSGLTEIQQINLMEEDDEEKIQDLVDTGTKYIFDTTEEGNDPMISNSIFNAHREAVIRKSIQTNLATVIANYTKHNNFSTYDFRLPKIDEESWYNIANNVSIISFMQGMPIGMKYYNNYSVVTSTKNEEVINSQTIYVVAEDSSGSREYHQPGCDALIKKAQDGSTKLEAYSILSFQRQTAQVPDMTTNYFYPQSRITTAGVKKTITGCYNCIVNATADYDIDAIIAGKITKYNDPSEEIYDVNDLKKVRQIYLQALARERYDLYKSNFDLGN